MDFTYCISILGKSLSAGLKSVSTGPGCTLSMVMPRGARSRGRRFIIAAPVPQLPPVTNARLFSSRRFMGLFILLSFCSAVIILYTFNNTTADRHVKLAGQAGIKRFFTRRRGDATF